MKAIVVGAGISGLATARYLVAGGAEVTVLEATSRIGGAIRTETRDGFLFEAGPDSFLTEKPAALQMCRELGLEGEVIGTNPDSRRSFIVRGGRMHATPEGFYLLAPMQIGTFLASSLISWPGKLRAGLDLILPRGPKLEDESLASFVRRRFGEEVLRYMAQPLVAGIYTADAEKLSLRATFPVFVEIEEKYRSITLGLKARRSARMAAAEKSAGPGAAAKGTSGARYGLFATMRGGLSALVSAVVADLPADTIQCGRRVSGIERVGRGWRVTTATGDTLSADAICLALPGPAAGALLGSVDGDLGGELAGISYASTVTVNLGYDRAGINHPLDGFGYVVPMVEKRDVLACTFSSVKFAGRAPAGKVLMRAFMGGASRPEIADLDDDAIVGLAKADLCELLGITREPCFAVVSKHAGSMPQYAVGHKGLVRRIQKRVAAIPGLALAGNAYDGIGLPDCIRSGREAAESLLSQP